MTAHSIGIAIALAIGQDPQDPKLAGIRAPGAQFCASFGCWTGGRAGKRKRPGRCGRLAPAHLPGLLEWTGPPLVERRALAFDSTCSHRPSRLSAWRAMPRSDSTPVARSRPRWRRFTLTRFPVPSVLVPIGTDFAESSWGGHSSFGSSTTAPLPTGRPKTSCGPDRLADPSVGGELPRTVRMTRQVSVSLDHPKVSASSVYPTPAPVSRDGRRLVVAADLPRESDSSVRGGREHCP